MTGHLLRPISGQPWPQCCQFTVYDCLRALTRPTHPIPTQSRRVGTYAVSAALVLMRVLLRLVDFSRYFSNQTTNPSMGWIVL